MYQYIKERLCPDKFTYVFIDEVQNCGHFEKAVDSLFIKPNVDIYITGSNAYMLSGELATVLSGRYITVDMLPLSFKEYCGGMAGQSKRFQKSSMIICITALFPTRVYWNKRMRLSGRIWRVFIRPF